MFVDGVLSCSDERTQTKQYIPTVETNIYMIESRIKNNFASSWKSNRSNIQYNFLNDSLKFLAAIIASVALRMISCACYFFTNCSEKASHNFLSNSSKLKDLFLSQKSIENIHVFDCLGWNAFKINPKHFDISRTVKEILSSFRESRLSMPCWCKKVLWQYYCHYRH